MKKKLQLIVIIAAPFLGAALLFEAKKGLELLKSKKREAFLNTMGELAVTLLEERYGEDFVYADFHEVIGMYGATLYYSGTCAPARDESLKFKVDLSMGEDRNYYIAAEHYAAQTANRGLAREISKEFTDLWGNFRAECEILENSNYPNAPDSNDETTIQMVRNGELDWQSYMRHCGILYNDASGGHYEVELYILVDESSVKCSPGEEYDAILKAIEKYREIVSPNNVRFLVYVHAAQRELYGKCDDILESHRYAGAMSRYIDPYRIIKNNGRGHFIQMNEIYVSDGKAWTLDKQEYIKKRTAEFVETDE
ncbi:MAG: hypothetical protein K2J77_03415 [Oscillospiraceae bacterium]|nr:hypothetical protein [Oscillospiraceae bacterium]